MADGLRKCPKCQSINQTNRKACFKCGTNLEDVPEYDPEEANIHPAQMREADADHSSRRPK